MSLRPWQFPSRPPSRKKLSTAAADSQNGPLRVGAVQIGICGDDDPKTLPRLNSSFVGFWSRHDRGKAWADLSRAAWRTDEGYRRAAGRLGMNYDHKNKIARVAQWASERARKYGWKPTPEQPFFFYY